MWALSMDAVALGLIVMVFSSYIMWFRLKAKRLGDHRAAARIRELRRLHRGLAVATVISQSHEMTSCPTHLVV